MRAWAHAPERRYAQVMTDRRAYPSDLSDARWELLSRCCLRGDSNAAAGSASSRSTSRVKATRSARKAVHLRGVALLDAGIPGITLPEAIPTDPERAWKTWHFAFHLVPDLPETLLTGRERDYVDWFLKTKAHSPGAFDDADVDHYAASLAADGGLRASLAYYRDAAESARRNHQALDRQYLIVPMLGISSSRGSIPDMAASISPWADNMTGVVGPGG